MKDLISPIDELKTTFLEVISNKSCETSKHEFNFPIIYGIERLRLQFYRTYIILKKNKNFNIFEDYVKILDKDEEIIKFSQNDFTFCPKIYLFILIITEMLSYCDTLNYLKKYFIKNTILEVETCPIIKVEGIDIYKYDNDNYLVQVNDNKQIINKNDYVIESLFDEIIKYKKCPLKILFMRNVSFKRYMENYGEKGFLSGLKLYDSFIKYIKEFLKSKAMKDLFDNDPDFKNISALIQNDKYLDEILSTKHYKFLPFFQINNVYSFTNKEFLITVIDANPTIVQGLSSLDDSENEENLFHICLLFYIALIFINGGYFFESKIIGGSKRFKVIKLKHIISLLDGRVCRKSLKEFQNDLKSKFDINNLIDGKEKGGLLGEFLKLYKIDFNAFNKKTSKVFVNCRNSSSIEINLGSKVISSAWGHSTK